ncbi:major facilitator superfamily domain-containing protein [Lentinula raphanica]|uniref:Major facilitator superfamily domain-containing protein n=1 Tax=Lentinula raphanica TaxID=153919 RepID=A0AA38UJ50_9AGAR|nr:major facilitator superfamily domain-containing protein [Lentinula raphanica]
MASTASIITIRQRRPLSQAQADEEGEPFVAQRQSTISCHNAVHPTEYHSSRLPKPERTPIPKLQVSMVLLIQLSEPIAATVIYPFVNQFVASTGITHGDEKKTGYYAGMIESVFFLAECVTVLMWGMASDRFGRRPVLLIGPLGLFFGAIGFGLSTSFWQLVMYRSIQGAFNGNIGVSKTVLAELADASNLADVFSFNPMMWCLGGTIGPFLGGTLSEPAKQWPNTLGKILLLQEHPFFLPLAVSGSLSLLFVTIAFFGLKETRSFQVPAPQLSHSESQDWKPLSKKRLSSRSIDGLAQSAASGYQYGSIASPSACSFISSSSYEFVVEPTFSILGTGDEDNIPQQSPTLRSLMTPQVLFPILSYSLLATIETSISVLIPITYTTSIASGGLGITSFQLGSILGTWGILNILFPTFGIPRLIRYFGPWKVQLMGMMCPLVILSSLITLNILAKRSVGGNDDMIFWVVVAIQFGSYTLMNMGFATAQMFVINGAPSQAALGTTNGLLQTAKTLSKTIAPVFAMSLFSISKEYNVMDGYLVYFFFIGVTVFGIMTVSKLPKELLNLTK